MAASTDSTVTEPYMVKILCLQNETKDLIFVDKSYKIKGYRCCYCQHVAIDHRIANCGDLYCSYCFTTLQKTPCPICQNIVEIFSQDQSFESEVLDLKVECKFRKDGCNVNVELKDFLSHAQTCEFAIAEVLPELSEEDRTSEVFQELKDVYRRSKQAIKLMTEDMSRMNADLKKIVKDAVAKNWKISKVFQVVKNFLLEFSRDVNEFVDAKLGNQQETKVINQDMNQLEHDLAEDDKTVGGMEADSARSSVESQETEDLSEQNKPEYAELTELKDCLHKSERKIELLKQAMELQQRRHHNESQINFCLMNGKELSELQYFNEGNISETPSCARLWKVEKLKERLQDKLSTGLIPLLTTCNEEFFTFEGKIMHPYLYSSSESEGIDLFLDIEGSNSELTSHKWNCFLVDQSNALEKKNFEISYRPMFPTITADGSLTSLDFPHISNTFLSQEENRYYKNDRILILYVFEPNSLTN